jgi:hypothetical protein
VGDRNTNKEKADWLVQTEKHRDKERKKDKKVKGERLRQTDGQISEKQISRNVCGR